MEYFGNTINEYLITLGVFVGIWLVLRFFQGVVLRRLTKLSEKTETDIDDVFIKIANSIRKSFYAYLSFYISVTIFLTLPQIVSRWIWIILLVWIVYQFVESIAVLIDYAVKKKSQGEDRNAESAFRFLGNILKWILWLIGLLLILSNLGINVNSLIAGLGIGGIAIAMAIQGVLEDLFSAFSIYFDKPFIVGDTIKVGSDVGTVEKIGIKTTRLRSLQSNEELVISNKELTSSRIQNYKKIQERRISLKFGVLYETSNEKLKKIPKIIESVVGSTDKLRLDRAHFTSFGDSALGFEVIYFVESSDYTEYLNAQQEVNLKIKEEFEKEGIEMAYPTQTIYLSK